VSAAGGGRSLDEVGGEELVDEAHDHRSVADGGGAALDGSRANIPTAKTPGTLVSRMPSAPALRPVSTKPSSSSPTVPSQSVFGAGPRRKTEESGIRVPMSAGATASPPRPAARVHTRRERSFRCRHRTKFGRRFPPSCRACADPRPTRRSGECTALSDSSRGRRRGLFTDPDAE
jgi:hypothetical protein